MTIKALVSLSSDEKKNVGRERIALLEAVGRTGSISAAARQVGLSYKAAWDGLEAIQNLVSTPLLEKSAGGRDGGGAALTPAGLALIETFHRLEAGLAALLNNAEPTLKALNLSSAGLLQGFMVRTSARNVFSGTIEAITLKKPAAFLRLRIANDFALTAQITTASLETLGLVIGRQVAALIKAPFVHILNIDEKAPENFNITPVKIRHIESGDNTLEVVADIGTGRTIVATLEKHKAPALNVGAMVNVVIDPNDIIIATT